MPGTRNGNGAHVVPRRQEPASVSAPPHQQEQSSINVGSVERYVSAGVGVVLALFGLSRRNAAGLAVAAVGAGLVYRGVSGHCPLYDALDIDTSGHRDGEKGVAPGHGIHVIRAVTIDRPADELYAFWRQLDNLPRIMHHLESVTETGRRSHWVAKAPLGTVAWDAEISAEEQGRLIGWRSLPGASVATEGTVRFYPASNGNGTVVRVDLRYDPPAGALGSWLAWLFGEEPSVQIAEDLLRFKKLMETGDVLDHEGQRRF